MIAFIPKYQEGICKCGATGCPDACHQECEYHIEYHIHKEDNPKPKIKKQKSYSRFLPKKWDHKC